MFPADWPSTQRWCGKTETQVDEVTKKKTCVLKELGKRYSPGKLRVTAPFRQLVRRKLSINAQQPYSTLVVAT